MVGVGAVVRDHAVGVVGVGRDHDHRNLKNVEALDHGQIRAICCLFP